MRKHHPANERIKRQYFIYLEEAHRMVESSVDQVAAAISLFEHSTGYRDFKRFHIEQARKFKRQLNDQINSKTGKPLAKATIYSRLMALKAFVKWLAGQPGYKSRITYSDAEYFNPSANDERIAKAVRQRPVPSMEQIRQVLFAMPKDSVLQRRDRALFAFTLLSGMRDDAIASLSLGHIDLEKRTIFQDARQVRTKTRKTFVTTFFPVGDDIEAIVAEWVVELQQSYGPADPLFPATKVGLGASGNFEALGLERRHWKGAGSIRKIFKAAFENTGLPYFHPHSFRKTIATLGEKICRSPEEFKAWSQNLAHENVLTTFTSYGVVAGNRQADILEGLRNAGSKNYAVDPDENTIRFVIDFLKKKASQ